LDTERDNDIVEDGDLDEEARIFRGSRMYIKISEKLPITWSSKKLLIVLLIIVDVHYESYRQERHSTEGTQVDTIADSIYRNLSKKHHVLKKVRDYDHCGAMRFQYEGPAFCCRKGRVRVFIPEVPEELKRLWTSQDDDDAKYFREHIRYFNSHFSFTSLGVTLDRRVSTAAGTGNYTFRAHGMLYHKMDDLIPGDNGPRHLQLYIYDSDESLSHRVHRSPDLNVDLIRKILRILEHNPYVQTFKTVGSFSNLDEYRIELNTNITLDQRRYNAPTTSEVAAIWVEGNDPTNCFDRSVVVHGKGGRPMYIRAYNGCYDPLAYPLFFPGGKTGWNRKMPYLEPTKDLLDNSDLAPGVYNAMIFNYYSFSITYMNKMGFYASILITYQHYYRSIWYVYTT
jgi:hypothetical protein